MLCLGEGYAGGIAIMTYFGDSVLSHFWKWFELWFNFDLPRNTEQTAVKITYPYSNQHSWFYYYTLSISLFLWQFKSHRLQHRSKNFLKSGNLILCFCFQYYYKEMFGVKYERNSCYRYPLPSHQVSCVYWCPLLSSNADWEAKKPPCISVPIVFGSALDHWYL